MAIKQADKGGPVRFRGGLAAVVGVLMLIAGWAAPGTADTVARAALPDPTGPVVLTVTGLDPATYKGGQVRFDLAMLRTLGRVTITTSTIWTAGAHVYVGVPLAELADRLDFRDRDVTLHALNDYTISLPADEAGPAAPILAYDMDGAPMPVRDKGPLWVIYPYDSASEYRTVLIYARSVWQLDRIDVTR